MASPDHYDVIVIGSGPGGGSLAHRLAPTGKCNLMLERGSYLPRSRVNWGAKTVFVDGAYQAPDIWYVLEMDFPDLRSIHASLDSDIKTETHKATLEVLKPFSGRLFHLIAENRALGAESRG